jgi:hypothetical protein
MRSQGGGSQPILTIAQVKWALAKTKDNITRSAELLGCNRSTIYNFIRNNPELHDFRYHVIGAVCDRAQEVVFDAVDSRDVQTSLKVLGTLHPAWKNKQTVEHHGTVQHSLAGQDVMTAEQIAAMSDADLKKMIAVREAERADARANIARIEAAIAERAAKDPVAGPGTGPETESGGSTSDL